MTLTPWIWHITVFFLGLIAILIRHYSLIRGTRHENVDNYQHTEAKSKRRFRKGCMMYPTEKGEN